MGHGDSLSEQQASCVFRGHGGRKVGGKHATAVRSDAGAGILLSQFCHVASISFRARRSLMDCLFRQPPPPRAGSVRWAGASAMLLLCPWALLTASLRLAGARDELDCIAKSAVRTSSHGAAATRSLAGGELRRASSIPSHRHRRSVA